MKTPKLVISLLASLLLVGCQKPQPPDFVYLDGSDGHYRDFNGHYLLINYWAEWCKPCITELPELNAFDKMHADIRVIGIHYDAPPLAKQQQLAGELGIEFDVILGQPHLHFAFELPRVLPTTAVISPEGKLLTLLRGPQDEHSLRAALAPFRQLP